MKKTKADGHNSLRKSMSEQRQKGTIKGVKVMWCYKHHVTFTPEAGNCGEQ